jgi:preprotein translocase subunit SecF
LELETEIRQIKVRNTRVEADKAWETSLFRKVLISVFTYILTAIVFYLIGVNNFLQSALIPTIGYFLSVQSLPFIKKWWIEKYYKQKRVNS